MKEAVVNMMIWMVEKMKLVAQEGYKYMLQDVNIYNIVMALMITSVFASFLLKKYFLQVHSAFIAVIENGKGRRMNGNSFWNASKFMIAD